MTQPALRDDPDALLAMLGEMASTEEAARFLESLVDAMFPDGATRERLTWPDQNALSAPATPTAELEKLRARFQTLVEQIPAVTFLAVLGEGENDIYISPHIEQLLGFTQKEWLEDPFLWYWQLHPDDRTMWNEEFARGVRTGGPFRAQCRFLARDGRTVWVHGEARLVRDAIGRPQFLQGVAFDITENKRAEAMLVHRAVEDAKRAEELDIARRVQTSIVPRTFSVPGLEIAAAMKTADEVGGDYYDVVNVDDGAWLGIGDVTGHGLNSGLVMLMVQSAAQALIRAISGIGPADLFRRLNDVLHDNVRNRLERDDHVTLSLLRYWHDGTLAFAGAHEELVLSRAGASSAELVPTPGPWLAAKHDLRRATIPETRLSLGRGDVLVLYTDGITEARDAEGRLFDVDRLACAVHEVRDRKVDAIRDHVLAMVERHSAKQEDDMSIVVVRYIGVER